MSTMGGGEKHIGAVAEHLSYKHDVTILTDNAFDMTVFKNRLNIDLSRVNVIVNNIKNNIDVSRFSYDFDLFINSTYQSTVYGFAKRNILFLFFPINIHSKFPIKIKKWVRSFIENYLFLGYKFISAYYPQEKYCGEVGNWTDNDICIFINKTFRASKIIFTYVDVDNMNLRSRIKFVKLNGVRVKYELSDKKLIIMLNEPQYSKNDLRLRIYMNPISRNLSKHRQASNLGMFITNTSLVYPNKGKDFVKKMINHFIKQQWIERLYSFYSNTTNIDFISSYDDFISNSLYTKHWTVKLLGVKSKMLPPPIDVDIFKSSSAKKNYIISVGRFFVGSHNKKHIELIKAFKKMYNDNFEIMKFWEYHLCGGTTKGRANKIYLKMVKREAEGYPIFIHENISLSDLIKLYSESKIFLHASGYNEDERFAPEKFEHFGITTVEAMASGCVPVVINKAGQRQIVQNNFNGYLWNDIDSLISHTIRLIKSPKQMSILSERAIKCSKEFSRAVFNRNLNRILNI